MKAFAVVLTLCVVGAYATTLNDQQKAKFNQYKQACITETGVDASVVEALLKGGNVPSPDKLKCFGSCMLKKIGVMTADGKYDVAAGRAKAATTKADQVKANGVIDKCKDLTGKDACETGDKIFSCFMSNSKDYPVLN